jgi:hypothetical protein
MADNTTIDELAAEIAQLKARQLVRPGDPNFKEPNPIKYSEAALAHDRKTYEQYLARQAEAEEAGRRYHEQIAWEAAEKAARVEAAERKHGAKLKAAIERRDQAQAEVDELQAEFDAIAHPKPPPPAPKPHDPTLCRNQKHKLTDKEKGHWEASPFVQIDRDWPKDVPKPGVWKPEQCQRCAADEAANQYRYAAQEAAAVRRGLIDAYKGDR